VQSEDVEQLGNGEDHVEVGHREKLGAASFGSNRKAMVLSPVDCGVV
jgi:hypothetical protein